MNILEMSLQASLMIAVIIIVRALGVNRLPKWGIQALWGLVVARLLVPLRIEFHLSAYNAVPEFGRALSPMLPVNAAPVDIGLASVMAVEPARAAASAAVPALPVSPWLVIWLVGAVLLFMYFALAHLRWRRTYAKARLLSVQRAGGFRWSRRVAVKVSRRVDAPLTYGVIRPVILMPEKLLNRREFDCALAHEMIHVRHWDALMKWLLTLTACVHWFNPLAWAMYVLASRDIELYCDEALLRGLGNGGRARYASMLIDLEEARSAPAPLISHFGRNAVEERIRAIMRYRKASILGATLALLLVALTAAALATSAVTAAPSEANPAAAAVSLAPDAAPPEASPVATAGSLAPAPTPEVLEDGWIRVPNRFSAEDIPPESYRLNDPGASDILYRYRMAPLPLDVKALAERFFGEDVDKLTLNASPDAFRKSTGRRKKGIASGDSDIYAVSDDFAYQLYRDVDTGALRLLKPNGILEVPGGDFDGPVVDYSRSASDPGAGEAVEAALGFLREACGMDTGLLTPVYIQEIPDQRRAQGYRIDFGYILDGRQLLGDPDASEYIFIVYVVDGVVTDLNGNLFRVESRSPVSPGDMPMDEASVLEIATRENHPPYGRPEICYCLDLSEDAGYVTWPIWVLPELDLSEEARCLGFERRDGRTEERL